MSEPIKPPVQPLPWSVHRTGAFISIKDANNKWVLRKSVAGLPSIDAYQQISANFEHIVAAVNSFQQVKNP